MEQDFSHEARIVCEAICAEASIITAALTAPSVIFKPKLKQLSIGGWEVTYGDLVAGGGTPEKAMTCFDKAWRETS